jgi:hypothetical protein
MVRLVGFPRLSNAIFVKFRDIWNYYVILRKQISDFHSLRSLPLRKVSFWKGRQIAWITVLGSALPQGL